MYFIKIPKLNLVIFYNARVGCTTIKRWAAAVIGLYPKPGQYIHELFQYNKNDIDILTNTTIKKVLVVRCPINRILSAAEHVEIINLLGLKLETSQERRIDAILNCVEDSIPNYTFTNTKLQHHLDLQCRMLQDPNFHNTRTNMRHFFNRIINLDEENLLDALNGLLPPSHARISMKNFNQRTINKEKDAEINLKYNNRINQIYACDMKCILPEKSLTDINMTVMAAIELLKE